MRTVHMTLALAFVAGAAQAQAPQPAGLTLERFVARQETRIMAADSDGDGRISLAEFQASAKGHGDAAARFARIDANHDGYLEKSEIETMLARRFHRLDRDGDGIVTPAERAAAHGGGNGKTGK